MTWYILAVVLWTCALMNYLVRKHHKPRETVGKIHIVWDVDMCKSNFLVEEPNWDILLKKKKGDIVSFEVVY